MVITILSEFKFLVTCSSCAKHIEVTVIFPSSIKYSKSYITLSSIYSLLLQRYEFILCINCCNFFGRLVGNYGIEHVHFQYLWSYSVFQKYVWGINLNQKDMVTVRCNTDHCFVKTEYREILQKICRLKKFIDSKSLLPPIFNSPFVGGEIRVIRDLEMQRISKIGGTLFYMVNKMKQIGKERMLDFQCRVVDRVAANSSSEATDQSHQEPAENNVSSLGDHRIDGHLVTTVMVYNNDFQFSLTCNGCLRQIEIAVVLPPSAQYSETYVSLRSVYSIMQDQFEYLFCETCYNFINQLSLECEVDNNSIFQEVWTNTLINAYITGINFHADFVIRIQFSCNHCFLGITHRDTFDRMCNFKSCIEYRPRTENMQAVELESTSTSTSGVEKEQINDISSSLDVWEQQNIASFRRFFSGSTTETTTSALRPTEKSDSDSLSSLSDDGVGAKLILLQPSRCNVEVDNTEIPTGSTNSDDANNGTNGGEQEGKIRLQYFSAARTFMSNSENGSHSSLSSDDDEDVGAKLILLQPSRHNNGFENGVGGSNDQTTNPNTNVPTLDYFNRPTNGMNRPKWEKKKGKELFSSCSAEVDAVMAEDDPAQLHDVWIPSSSNQILYNGLDDDSDSISNNSYDDDDMAAEVILIQPFGVTRHFTLRNEGTSSTDQNETANTNHQSVVDYSDGSVRIMMYDSEEEISSDESEDLNLDD